MIGQKWNIISMDNRYLPADGMCSPKACISHCLVGPVACSNEWQQCIAIWHVHPAQKI